MTDDPQHENDQRWMVVLDGRGRKHRQPQPPHPPGALAQLLDGATPGRASGPQAGPQVAAPHPGSHG